MNEDGDIEIHSTRKVREAGNSVVVTIPKDAVERSGIELGEQVMVGSIEDGPVTLIPWSEDDLRSMLDQRRD
ncbi:hypothetical protein C5B89_09355 [Haloferax sp. Atlit-47N]|nr:hypothetical protein C5B89_09355 [Haloferax sp. Atlit-47N]